MDNDKTKDGNAMNGSMKLIFTSDGHVEIINGTEKEQEEQNQRIKDKVTQTCKAKTKYNQGKLPLISNDMRTGYGEQIYEDTETEFGIGAVLFNDGGKAILRVNQERFDRFIHKELLSNYEKGVYFVRHVFERLLWIANYCENNVVFLDSSSVASLLFDAQRVVGDLVDIEGLDNWEKTDWDCFLYTDAKNLDRSIDLLFAECVSRESIKATLEMILGESDKEKLLERLNDKNIDRLFDEVNERCDIVKAVKIEIENGVTKKMEKMNKAVNAIKEQLQAAEHFPKTGIWLSLAEATELFYVVFKKKFQKLDMSFPVQINHNNTSNLCKAFGRWTDKAIRDYGLASQMIEGGGNGRMVKAFDLADYYELFVEHLAKAKCYFKDISTFKDIVNEIIEFRNLKKYSYNSLISKQ